MANRATRIYSVFSLKLTNRRTSLSTVWFVDGSTAAAAEKMRGQHRLAAHHLQFELDFFPLFLAHSHRYAMFLIRFCCSVQTSDVSVFRVLISHTEKGNRSERRTRVSCISPVGTWRIISPKSANLFHSDDARRQACGFLLMTKHGHWPVDRWDISRKKMSGKLGEMLLEMTWRKAIRFEFRFEGLWNMRFGYFKLLEGKD